MTRHVIRSAMAEPASLATLLLEDATADGQAKISVDDLCLLVLEGPAAGRSIPIDKECTVIGRKDWCDLGLNDPRTSNPHFELRLTDEGVRLRDLGSKNGVLVGEFKILDGYLKPGDQIKVGRSRLELRLANEEKREIEIKYQDESGLLFGKSDAMRQLFSYLKRLGKHDINLLLTGETGTGKSHTAHALHLQSHRRKGPFVTVNCAGIASNLIEAELFGYEKGAFTGAEKQHKGYFEQAHGGTLFLDEIGELPIELQPKLLDVVQRRKVRRLGATSEIDVDVRLVAATNPELVEEMAEGHFREDLYHRIAEMALEVPPLRERREDIPLLANHILKTQFPDRSILLTPQAVELLQSLPWSGNVRDLTNLLKRSVVMLDGDLLDEGDLFFGISPAQQGALKEVQASRGATTQPKPADEKAWLYELFLRREQPFDEFVDWLKETLLQQAYDELDQSAAEVARTLKKSRSWTYDKLNHYDIRSK